MVIVKVVKMNVNFLNLFFRPRKMVQLAQDKPNLKLALFVVVLPTIISFLGNIAFGFPITALSFAFLIKSAVKYFAIWLIISIIFYIVAFIVRGKVMRGTFSGIASILSLPWVIASLLTVLSFTAYFISPVVFETSRVSALEGLETGQALELAAIVSGGSDEALAEFISENGIERAEELWALKGMELPLFNPIPLLLFVLLGALFFFYGIALIPFFAIAEIFEVNFLYDLLLWLFLGAISFGVFGLLLLL